MEEYKEVQEEPEVEGEEEEEDEEEEEEEKKEEEENNKWPRRERSTNAPRTML